MFLTPSAGYQRLRRHRRRATTAAPHASDFDARALEQKALRFISRLKAARALAMFRRRCNVLRRRCSAAQARDAQDTKKDRDPAHHSHKKRNWRSRQCRSSRRADMMSAASPKAPMSAAAKPSSEPRSCNRCRKRGEVRGHTLLGIREERLQDSCSVLRRHKTAELK